MLRTTLAILLALPLLSLALAPAGVAQETENPAVAVVNGQEILQSEVLELAESLPPEYKAQLAILFPTLVERLIDMKLVALAAAEAGLGEDDEVRQLLEIRKEAIMRDVYLERLIAEQVTDDKVRAHYDVYIEENPPEPEVKARHILLATESDAQSVIAELEGGADFATLASERSTGPSSADGGDLGYFTKGQMVPSFAEAAFALEPGSYTDAPVETQFGWHVILVEDRRSQEAPSFEDVEIELENDLRRSVVRGRIDELRAAAEVELVEPAESPAESEGASQ